jgi:hypothetical protein
MKRGMPPTRRRSSAHTRTKTQAPRARRRLPEPTIARAEALAKGLTERSSDRAVSDRQSSHWRYLRGKLECLENGQTPTTVNLAKRLGISRIAIWKLTRRYPWLDAWCDEVLRESNANYWGAVERRMALVALQGSVPHADQYCKMRANTYAKPVEGPGGTSINHGFVINNLIPRPEPVAMPTEVKRLRLPPPDSVPVVDVAVPVVHVRGPR